MNHERRLKQDDVIVVPRLRLPGRLGAGGAAAPPANIPVTVCVNRRSLPVPV